MKPVRSVMPLDEALRCWREAVGDCDEIAVVANPSYVASPYELYPLAPRNPGPLDALLGAVMDMDGTTTTTEPLCLHSLEWMVRVVTDRMGTTAWAGLDAVRDHPHVIGNSTTRHVEYLLRTYGDHVRPDAFRRAFARAVLWTLARGRDEARRSEVQANAAALGLRAMLDDPEFARLVRDRADPFGAEADATTPLVTKYAAAVRLDAFAEQVRAAVDVYYVRYHLILAAIDAGQGDELAREFGLAPGSRLVAPMPGVGAFLAMTKGWLGEEAASLYEPLAAHVRAITGAGPAATPDDLRRLGQWFEAHPVRIAVVTSSIAYEAHIVLMEVFRTLYDDAATWPISPARRERVAQGFADHCGFYDAVVTATDSSEIRLKPHRDLYAIALHVLGIAREDYRHVVGFEDSESGTIAIRAAGVGCCVALPFAQSAGHDFAAAVHVVRGQLPEVMLNHRCFLAEKRLAALP